MRRLALRRLGRGFGGSRIQDALLTTDRAKKTEIYNKVQDILWQDCPWVYVYVSQSVSANDKRLKNFYLMPDGGFEFSQAEWVE